MKNKTVKRCKTIIDTERIAKVFAAVLRSGCFVNLYGDIGAGKTAFVKLVAKSSGVSETVTSPSFVILNEYHSGVLPIYHFDLYRLEDVGISSIMDELREYSTGLKLTFVEWAEFSQGEIPFKHLNINVICDDNDERVYEFSSDYYDELFEELEKC